MNIELTDSKDFLISDTLGWLLPFKKCLAIAVFSHNLVKYFPTYEIGVSIERDSVFSTLLAESYGYNVHMYMHTYTHTYIRKE